MAVYTVGVDAVAQATAIRAAAPAKITRVIVQGRDKVTVVTNADLTAPEQTAVIGAVNAIRSAIIRTKP